MQNRRRALNDREELMRRNFTANDTASSSLIDMNDGELQLNDRMHSANRNVDDLLSQGAAALGKSFTVRVSLLVSHFVTQFRFAAFPARVVERR